MVRIGYDASSTVGRRTGIGIATAQLLNAIAESLPEGWRIRTLVNSGREPLPSGDAWTTAPVNEVRHTRIPGRLLLRAWQHLGYPSFERLAGDVALVHSPASYFPPARRAKRVITVHDLFFLKAPKYDGPPEAEDAFGGAYFRATFPRALPRADAIIAVSQCTKDEIIEQYKIPEERITVIHHGVDHGIFHPKAEAGEDSLIAAWTMGNPFLLCVASSGASRRKNLGALLDAYHFARRRSPAIPRLVIAGHSASPEAERAFRAKLDELRLRDHVIVAGYLPPGSLAAFYRHAVAMVIPSLSEGFGLPALEAMACGCPVLAAESGALPEVTGGAALLFSLLSAETMGEAIVRACESDSLRERLRLDGIARAGTFTWRRSAERTIQLYADVLGVRL